MSPVAAPGGAVGPLRPRPCGRYAPGAAHEEPEQLHVGCFGLAGLAVSVSNRAQLGMNAAVRDFTPQRPVAGQGELGTGESAFDRPVPIA
ncbi:MAG: hypothetical protein ABI053_01465 [Lacisediminihabitans sp.]